MRLHIGQELSSSATDVKQIFFGEATISRPWAFEVIVMAVLLEQQKQLEAMERELQALRVRKLE